MTARAKGVNVAGLALRLRLLLLRAGPVTLGGIAMLALAAVFLVLVVQDQRRMERAMVALRAAQVQTAQARSEGAPASTPAAAAAAAPPLDAFDAFYGALGQRRDSERQLKTLFNLAAKSGLVLSQGEYKSAWDRNARVHTYQVNLPVKGSYAAIWQFSLAALRALPFAALDEVSFRRDNIGDPGVEARLRFTLYLADNADSADNAGIEAGAAGGGGGQ